MSPFIKLFLGLVSNLMLCSVFAADLPLNIVRHEGAEFDGIWSGAGIVKGGSGCAASPSIKFMVKDARIYMDGFTHGAFYGSGSSKVFGVIHKDKTVDLTVVERNSNGRSSQAYGSIDSQLNMILNDPGRCTFEYKLTKG